MRILIVEDEAISALLLERALRTLGHEVLKPVSTGEAALKSAAEGKPNLVLMDIRLGGILDGVETAEKIMQLIPCDIVFTTGYQDGDFYDRAMALRPRGYLIKPIMMDSLSEFLEDT